MDTDQPPPRCPYGHGPMTADPRIDGMRAAEYGVWWMCTYRRCTGLLVTPSLTFQLHASQPLTRIRVVA
jgi:hypothetical protein